MEELYEKYNYPSFAKFKQILTLNGVKASTKEIQECINNQAVAELHKPQTKNKKHFKFIVALASFEMLQIDLIDYQKYSHKNNGYNYILIAVDVFSRYAFASPIKKKTPEMVLKAFESFDVIPRAVFHDSGNEFKGSFLKFLNEHDVVNLHAEVGDHNSLGVIDRFSRTLKTVIAKYMTSHDTTTYYNKIDSFIEGYNNTPHASLANHTPASVLKDKKINSLIQKINLEKMKYNAKVTNKIISKIKVGDKVRVQIKKNLFNKGYEITFTKQIYTVESIDGEKALLDDGHKYNINKLLLSKYIAKSQTFNKDADDLNARVKRKVRREGLDYDEELYWDEDEE